ncbi:lysosomal cystine transporter [Colletotrichum orchidophilum]|uniref:Lysosomal cystine transporter n=1 Tax=Colletotrichum orchidophilum TaxID=1209926 RepID=A0A1G4AS11_9PEZI|nr:lysosomal cystine transporter [Colletotrichum orchidophilum]OHE91896.1 lysosomal cystine transporter [Colletotrichum orchidophilum]
MASPRCFFLELPCEIRLDIYTHLLLHPPLDRLDSSLPHTRLHPAILAASRQIHAEGMPILYCNNIFLAHAKLLSSFPRLRSWYPPVRERSVLPRIRRFHIRVRLDCDLAFDAEAATAAFSGVDELLVEVWQAAFQSADHGALYVFEGVRGVKAVRIYGSITGFEVYVSWLEGVMRWGGDLDGKDAGSVDMAPSQTVTTPNSTPRPHLLLPGQSPRVHLQWVTGTIGMDELPTVYHSNLVTGLLVTWAAPPAALGFLAYFVSNAAFYYSPVVRAQYAARNHGLTPTVAFNDITFAAHALLLSFITTSQYLPKLWGFTPAPGTKPSRFILGIASGCIVGVAIVGLIVASAPGDGDPVTSWCALDVVYAVSYVKLVITLIKYTPQVITNYRNKSTKGWSIWQILLDFSGGLLSVAQQAIDSYLQRDWSGITGNPVKFALGNVSMVYDLVFMTQHYVLYRGSDGKADERDSLLRADDEEHQRLD